MKRRYSYAINGVYKKASIHVEHAPFYIFWLEDVFNFICNIIPCIPFPNIKIKLISNDSIDINGGEKYSTMKEWWGDLNQCFCVTIHMPISKFCNSKTKHSFIDVDYDKLKEAVYIKDKGFWDYHDALSEHVETETNK